MIEQIKQALENATPGPWEYISSDNVLITSNRDYSHACEIADNFGHEYDAHLISNAPEWLRYLIGEVERLQSELDTWVGKTDRWVEEADNRQIEIEKLQKALEQIKYMPSTPPMIRAIADLALERTKP